MDKYEYVNFLVSDIHSFAKPLRDALRDAGFRVKDKTHRLIILGDIFDRGPDTLEVYKFIKSLPKHRRVLIKGNHEQLYFELLKKNFPDDYDFSNGTVNTFCQIAGTDPEDLDMKEACRFYYLRNQTPPIDYLSKRISAVWKQTKAIVAEHEITKWLDSSEWLDFFEYKDLICVHSFIPEYVENWREAHASAWSEARWGCPWRLFQSGYFDEEAAKGKKLVCGHWHAQEFHKVFEKDFDNWELYFGENLIALDGCCVVTKSIPVLKVTPDGYFDKYGRKLVVKQTRN